jgi:hypothetical protein
MRDVSPDSGTRLVCYCDDCQAFARWLDRGDALDAWGGTDVFQVAPSTVSIDEGIDAVRCVRLSPKGMHRFYSVCCRTPIGNALGARVPFFAVISAFVDHAADGRARDDVLGPPVAFVLGRFAKPGAPKHVHAGVPPQLLVRAVWPVVKWWRAGKGRPTPFFDDAMQPVVPPYALAKEERDALR